MRRTRIVLWGLGTLLAIGIIAAISIPNLLKARIAANSRLMRESVSLVSPETTAFNDLSAKLTNAEKKVIFNGNLSLIVADVHKTADDVRKLVESQKGEIQEMEVSGSRGNSMYATIRIRV